MEYDIENWKYRYGDTVGYHGICSGYATEDVLNAMGYETTHELHVSNKDTKNMLSEIIKGINIIVPNKVVEVTFADSKKEKMVCHKDDTFDLRKCLFIALAKHLYRDEYTFDGIEKKARELSYLKQYVKIVDSALKSYDKKQKYITRLETMLKAEQERIERKRAKRQAYRERRAARREQEERDKQIAIQREAYIQAMNAMKEENVQ